jgi:hypothetical protein
VYVPKRVEETSGRQALVDGIPFDLPIRCARSPALFAVFSADLAKAQALMPERQLHPLRLWNRAVLVVTVIDYRETSIGKYIEFSVALACTQGTKPAPRFLPALFMKAYGTGQLVLDLPVSTEISVKGGKGIWGMPKHQASLDFVIGEQTVSSQYDQDGQFVMKIEIDRPSSCWLPVRAGIANYSCFRGMLMRSLLYFRGRAGFSLRRKGAARLVLGDHPRIAMLRDLDLSPDPLLTAFIPSADGVLDDSCQSWFLHEAHRPATTPEGMESVVDLGLGQQWPPPPTAPVPNENR